MSGAIDKQYVNYLATRLERFKWVRSNVAVCRCPFCGDGRKGSKTRFYIYQEIKHSTYLFNVNCKNCGHSESFHNFLKVFDPSMFGQYRMDKFRDKYNKEPRDFFAKAEPEKISTSIPSFGGGLQIEVLPHTVTVESLPDGHSCKEYVRSRKIPEKFWNKLLYTEDFNKLTGVFVNEEYAKKIPNDERLVIPFYSAFGTIEMLQGRSLDPTSKMRYISIKKNDAIHKVYGMERIDKSKTVYVVEGPIDSLFIDNCLAAADADLLRIKGDVYIFDCQYRNKDVCRHIDKAIEAGVKVVLFPADIPFKDINDMVKDGGMSNEDVLALINKNTFSGLRAKLAFTNLRRI
jgi:hypothetical protein